MDPNLIIAAEFIWREFNSGHMNILDFLSLADLERIKEGRRNHFMSYTTWNIVVDNYISAYWYQRLNYYCYVNNDFLIEKYGFPMNYTHGEMADYLVEMEIIKRAH